MVKLKTRVYYNFRYLCLWTIIIISLKILQAIQKKNTENGDSDLLDSTKSLAEVRQGDLTLKNGRF